MHLSLDKFRCLVICDQNLYESVTERVKCALPFASCLRWRPHNLSDQKKLDACFSGNQWDVLLSVYSDYLLSRDELSRVRIPLNIHPALPSLPGVGYDILPMLRKHTACGATAHWIDTKVDHGAVLDTLSVSIDGPKNYASIRNLNQQAVLSLLNRWLHRLADSTPAEFDARIRVPVQQRRGWSGEYVSKRLLAREMFAYKNRSPSDFACFEIPPQVEAKLCQSLNGKS